MIPLIEGWLTSFRLLLHACCRAACSRCHPGAGSGGICRTWPAKLPAQRLDCPAKRTANRSRGHIMDQRVPQKEAAGPSHDRHRAILRGHSVEGLAAGVRQRAGNLLLARAGCTAVAIRSAITAPSLGVDGFA